MSYTLTKCFVEALMQVERHVRQKRYVELDTACRDLELQMHVDDDVKVNALMRAQDLLKDALLDMLHIPKPLTVTIAFGSPPTFNEEERKAIVRGAQKGLVDHHRITKLDVRLQKIGVHESIAGCLSVFVLNKPGEVRVFLRKFEKEMPPLLPQLRLSGPP